MRFPSTVADVLVDSVGVTSNPGDLLKVGMAMREAYRLGIATEVASGIMERRAEWLAWLTVTQRSWQSKVSHRPQRGTHHDSWEIRERYVRCSR